MKTGIVVCVFAALSALSSAAEAQECSLCIPAAEGDLQKVRALLDEGADPNMRGPFDGTPLMYAARHGQAEVAGLLLDEGADEFLLNAHGLPALLVATMANQTVVVRTMLEKDANPNVRQLVDGNLEWSPMLYAARYGYAGIVSLLLAAGGSPNRVRQSDRVRPLMLAAAIGDLEIARMLLVAGADPDFQTARGSSALMFAAYFGRRDMLELLVEEGNAEVDLTDEDLRDAKRIALYRCDYFAGEDEIDPTEIAAVYLLDHGTSIDYPDAFGFGFLDFSNCSHLDPPHPTIVEWGGEVPGGPFAVSKEEFNFVFPPLQ